MCLLHPQVCCCRHNDRILQSEPSIKYAVLFQEGRGIAEQPSETFKVRRRFWGAPKRRNLSVRPNPRRTFFPGPRFFLSDIVLIYVSVFLSSPRPRWEGKVGIIAVFPAKLEYIHYYRGVKRLRTTPLWCTGWTLHSEQAVCSVKYLFAYRKTFLLGKILQIFKNKHYKGEQNIMFHYF